MKISKYYLAAIFSYVIWGFFSLALKPLSHHSAMTILFFRIFFSVLFAVAVCMLFRRDKLRESLAKYKSLEPKTRKRAAILTIGGGILLSANWLSFIYVMNHINLKAGSFAYLICPILTALISVAVLGEKLKKWQWAAVVLSAASCVLLGFKHMNELGYSLIVAVSYALYLVSQSKNHYLDRFVQLTLQLIVALIVTLPLYPSIIDNLPSDTSFYLIMVLVALLFTVTPLLLNLFAFQGVSSSTVGILLYLNPLINFALAVLYFKEKVSTEQAIAYLLIVGSIVLFNQKIFFPQRR